MTSKPHIRWLLLPLILTFMSSCQASPAEPTESEPSAAEQKLDSVALELELYVEGLQRPVSMADAGDGSGRLFVVENRAGISILQDGQILGPPFLDLSERIMTDRAQQGVVDVAFSPNYSSDGRFYVMYTDLSGDSVLSRFEVSESDPNQAQLSSEVIVLVVEQPGGNHNCGELVFGPDGYLYIGCGEGGAGGKDWEGEGAPPEFDSAQDGQLLLGSILRLDVSAGTGGYAIPPDNPFVGSPDVLGEIWAMGLRNPWRFTFDRSTGDLYIADVGAKSLEEVNFHRSGDPGGQNYGWPIMEGRGCFEADPNCGKEGLTRPVMTYPHDDRCAIIGGHVYRGSDYPALNGVYLLADFCTGDIFGLLQTPEGEWRLRRLIDTTLTISSFGEDERGEMYVVDMGGGVYRVKAEVAEAPAE